MLNPHFLKDVIPGDFRPYNLTLPTQQCLSYIMSEKRILDYDKELYARRTTAEPGGASNAQPMPVSDGGQANLANASRQTANAESNNEIATQATERVVKKTHTVSRGENIRDIAKMYAVSATDIKRWNKLRRGKVKEGDQLIIEVIEHVTPEEVRIVAAPEVEQVLPKESETAAAPEIASAETKEPETKPVAKPQTTVKQPTTQAKPKENTQKTKSQQTTTYKVKKGDTLARISRMYGTTVEAIQAANGMKNTNLQIDQVLKIPAKGNTSAPKSTAGTKKSTTGRASKTRR